MSNAISANRDQTIVGELKMWPPWRPLDYVPSTYEVAVIIRALSTPKAVGPDDLPAYFLRVLADERESNTLGNFHDIIVAVWEGGDVPRNVKCSDQGATQESRLSTG